MGWQWHQLDHMQISCTLLQTDNHTSTSSLKTTEETQSVLSCWFGFGSSPLLIVLCRFLPLTEAVGEMLTGHAHVTKTWVSLKTSITWMYLMGSPPVYQPRRVVMRIMQHHTWLMWDWTQAGTLRPLRHRISLNRLAHCHFLTVTYLVLPLLLQLFYGSQWDELDHMQICTSPRQLTTRALHHSVFFTGRTPFLPPNQQCQSIEGMISVDGYWVSVSYWAE